MISAEQIIQCYHHLISAVNVEQASAYLTEVYNSPDSIPIVVSILKSNEDEIIKKYASFGLKNLFINQWKGTADKMQILPPIFQLLSTTESLAVAECLVNMINDLPDPSCRDMVIAFIQQAASTPSPMLIDISLRFLEAYMQLIGVENTMGLYQSLISTGFQQRSPETQIIAISCAFQLSSICGNPLSFGPVFPQSLALLSNVSLKESLLMKLLDIFEKNLYRPCPLINICLLLSQIISVINNANYSLNIRKYAFKVLTAIIINFQEDIFDEQSVANIQDNSLILSIYQSTLNLTAALYNETDVYTMSPFDVIEPISEVFANYPSLLEFFTSQVTTVLDRIECGLFFSSVFIRFSLDDGYDFYETKLDEIAMFLCNVISSCRNSLCTREAAIHALSNFSITFSGDIQMMTSVIQETVLNSIFQSPSVEMITAFSSLIEAIDDSDPIFGQAVEYFVRLLNASQLDAQEQIMWCISSLIKSSKNEVRNLFPQIFNVMKPLIELEDEAHQTLRGTAIYCMSHLSQKCPEEFFPFAESFAQFILSNVTTGDMFVATRCVNAYSYLLQRIKDSTKSTVERMAQILVQFCQMPVSDDESGLNPITLQDISLRVLCCCNSEYPMLLQNMIGTLLDLLSNSRTIHAAIGASLISSVITSLSNRLEVVPRLIHILLTLADTSPDFDCVAKSFEALATLIEWCGAEAVQPAVLNAAANAFTFKLLCFTSPQEKYNEEVHNAAQLIFRQTIDTLQNTAFSLIQGYIDLFIQMSTCSKSKPMRSLGLQILADLIRASPSNMPSAVIQKVLEAAIEEAKRGNYIGYFAIKAIATSVQMAPAFDFFAEPLKSLVPSMIQRLSENSSPSTENSMMANDNCVSALGAILMNVGGNDDFVIDESVTFILNAMPPLMDVSENEDTLMFFSWLYEKANNASFFPQFAAVLVKLFTEEVQTMRENMIGDFTIQRLRGLLVQLVGQCGGEQFCASVLDGDEKKMKVLRSYLQ